ncbi:MAG: hypothetical protein GYA17_19255 [Chloroflexi bacterium]|jgi:hypothetical protein|nr:hypothetical protein [Anaerolineaceae bacterium]NMB90506.1 hypothetical protein [Chloroflexota bacterium]
MRIIRASEIGVYLYCRRSWWYQLQGVVSQNQSELAAGSAFHRSHGGKVFLSQLLRLAGWLVLLAAVVLIAVGLTLQWLY